MNKNNSSPLYQLIFMVCFLFTIVACGEVVVIMPVENDRYTEAPNIVVNLDEKSPPQVTATLNDVDISKRFTFEGTRGQIDGVDIKALLIDGRNQLSVTAPAKTKVNFYYDNGGPKVSFTHVRDNGGTVDVEGRVSDVSQVQSVIIGGQTVNLDDDAVFSTTISDTDLVTVTATDSLNKTRSETYARPYVQMEDSFAVRLEKKVFDHLIKDVLGIIYREGVNDFILAQNPIIETTVNGVSVTVNVSSASINIPSGSFNVIDTTGGLTVNGVIPEYSIFFDVELGQPDGTVDRLSGSYRAGQVAFDSYAQTYVDEGIIKLEVTDTKMHVLNIQTELLNFPPWLSQMLSGYFKQFIQMTVKTRVESLYKEYTERTLNVISADLLISKNDGQVKPNVITTRVSTPNGGVNIYLKAHPEAQPQRKESLGSRYEELAPMPPLYNIAPQGKTQTVGAVLSINDINQTLRASFEAGIMSTVLTVDGNKVGGSRSDSYKADIILSSPPAMKFTDQGNALATISAYNVQLDVFLKSSGQNNYKPLFSTKFDLVASSDFDVTPDSKVKIKLIGFNEISFYGTQVKQANFSGEDVQSLLDSLVPIAGQSLTDVFTPMIPLPQFEGYKLKVGDVWIADSEKQYLAVGAEMIPLRSGE